MSCFMCEFEEMTSQSSSNELWDLLLSYIPPGTDILGCVVCPWIQLTDSGTCLVLVGEEF